MPAVGDLGAVATKECIEHVLGVDVELLDERRQPDLPDLLYQQKGRTVIVEVKRITWRLSRVRTLIVCGHLGLSGCVL
jgi:hypothetical protein